MFGIPPELPKRCATCAWWQAEYEPSTSSEADALNARRRDDKLGLCRLLGEWRDSRPVDRLAVPWDGETIVEFITRDVFGCVQWKEKQ